MINPIAQEILNRMSGNFTCELCKKRTAEPPYILTTQNKQEIFLCRQCVNTYPTTWNGLNVFFRHPNIRNTHNTHWQK